MFTVKKYIIGLVVGTMVFSGIAIIDEVIVKISMAIASSIASSIVGSLYSAGIITTKVDGGKARLLVFVILLTFFLYIFTQIAMGIIWLFSFPIWVYIVLLIISTSIFILFMILKNKKTIKKYDSKYVECNTVFNELESVNNNSIVVKETFNTTKTQLKSLLELLTEENEKDYVIATHNDPHSPGLEYVKVYKSSLKYQKIMGYIKMDRATSFWGEIYYAHDKKWIKC